MAENKESLFLGVVGDSLRNRVLEFFIEGRELDYPLKYVAEDLDIHRNTLYEIMHKLLSEGILIISRRIGSSYFYKINQRNLFALLLIGVFDKVLNDEISRIHKEALKEKELTVEVVTATIPVSRSDCRRNYLELPRILCPKNFSMYQIC